MEELINNFLHVDGPPQQQILSVGSNPPTLFSPDPALLGRIATALESLDAKTLTKREEIAKHIFSSLVLRSSDNVMIQMGSQWEDKLIIYARVLTDLLLEELGKETK